MAFSGGHSSITAYNILQKVSEVDILYHYFGVQQLPCLISSPLRVDKHPSFGLVIKDMKHIFFHDFALNIGGNIFSLLMLKYGCSYEQVLEKIEHDMSSMSLAKTTISIAGEGQHHIQSSIRMGGAATTLQIRTRAWKEYDLSYWSSYGISQPWLQKAEIYPLTHIFISYHDEEQRDKQYTIRADKYAYAFIENKENHLTMKIYQPFNTKGHKWYSKHDSSVVGLWTKVPPTGEKICICSSMKDALCLWANIGIPALYLQGEGYGMSATAREMLQRRYQKIFICFDNDAAGIAGSTHLAEQTGFTNITLPPFDGGKDISDCYKNKGREQFIEFINPLFINC